MSAIVITTRMPLVPTQVLNQYLGWLTCIILSLPLIYWLIFTRDSEGNIPLVAGLSRAQNVSQKAAVLVTPIIFAFCFYILGKASTTLITSYSILVDQNINQLNAKIVKIDKGRGWYRGTSKISLKLKNQNSNVALYWPNKKIQQDSLAEGQTVLVIQNETWLGDNIRSISRMSQ